jgi:hypothetical protein
MAESVETPGTASPQPYVPSGAAASSRMLTSVLGRVVGPYSAPISRTLRFADRLLGNIVDGTPAGVGREPAQRLYAQPVFASDEAAEAEGKPAARPRRERGAPAQELLTASPERPHGADLKMPPSLRPTMALSAPERMFGPGPPTRAAASPAPVEQAPPAERRDEPAEVLRDEPAERPSLDPLIAVAEAELDRSHAVEERREIERREAQLTLLRGGGRGRRAQSAITEAQAQKTAMEASRQLLEAMRTHAAHSGADDRVSLGDMTLIAFADSNKQMAAASAYSESSPQFRPIQKGLSHLAHPKVKEGQHDLHNKLKAMAKLVLEDRKRGDKMAKERFGENG